MFSTISFLLLYLVISSQQQDQKPHDPGALVAVEPGEDDLTLIIYYKVPRFTGAIARMVYTYTISWFDKTSASRLGPLPMFNLTRDNATDEIQNYTIDSITLLSDRIYVVCTRVVYVQDDGITFINGKDGTECAANRTRFNGTVIKPPNTVIGPMISSSDRSLTVVVHTSMELPYYVRYMQADIQGTAATGVTFDNNGTHQQTTFTFQNMTDSESSLYKVCAWTDYSGYFADKTPWVLNQCASLTPSRDSAGSRVDFMILSVIMSFIMTILI